jgi:hypothetical protein
MGGLALLSLCNDKRLLLGAHITVCSIDPFHIVGVIGGYSIFPGSVVLGGVHLLSSNFENFLPLGIFSSKRFAKDHTKATLN